MDAIAEQFTNFYYNTFDADRGQLAGLYRPNSMLTFEGSQLQGTEAIVQKLAGLPFQKVQHKVETRDAQPTGADGSSLVVMVTGALVVDDSPQPMRFSQVREASAFAKGRAEVREMLKYEVWTGSMQVFTLHPEAGSYYVFNDLFRLNYG